MARFLADAPQGLLAAIVAAYGLVIGSFLNVVIHRLPRGTSLVFPRSACPSCGRVIRWHENVPVLSWLWLRGRCAGCKGRISWRYPAVELLTSLVVLAAFERYGPTPGFVIAAAFLVLLLALIFIDLEHMLLPDALTLPGAFAGLALSFVSPFTEPADALLGALLGLFVIEGLNLAYKLLRGRDGMGAGDTKMMIMMGAFLGWQDVIVSLVLASFIGSLVAIPALAISRWMAAREPEGAGESSHSAEPAGAEAPSEGGAEPADTAGAASRRSALLDLVPSTRGELLALLAVLALLASLFAGPLDPARALAAFLPAVALHVAASRFVPRASRVTAWLPLAGALAGAPPTLVSAAIAGAAMLAVALLVMALGPRLPSTAEATETGAASEPGEPEGPPSQGEPALLQASIPFGVFLGIAGAIALLAGDDVVEWYLSLAARLIGPA